MFSKSLLISSVYIIILILTSCQNNMYSLIARSANDPFYSTPTVDSFTLLNGISIKWDKDESADEYVLLRSENKSIDTDLSFTEIYRGENNYYQDYSIITNTLYRYRLDKKRGSKNFEGREYSLGVGSPLQMNLNDDLSSKDKAFELKYKHNSSCCYYRFNYKGLVMRNYNWYKVKLEGMKKAQILLEGNNDDFQYFIPGVTNEKHLLKKEYFYVENKSYEEKYVFFVITSYPDNFVSSGFLGGDVKEYKIELTLVEAVGG